MFKVKWPALQSVTAGLTGSPGVITRDSEWTIAVIVPPNDSTQDYYVQLPSGCNIGDVVEVLEDRTNEVGNVGVFILPPSGEYFYYPGGFVIPPLLCRKITTSCWSFIS